MTKTTVFDYELVKRVSLDLVPDYSSDEFLKLDEDGRARIGFYFLIFDLLFEHKSKEEISSYIVDEDFLHITKKVNNKDLGIDAVYIDDDDKKVYLFNFKYRNSPGKQPSQKYQEVRSAETFLNYIIHDDEYEKDIEKLQQESAKTLEKINDIRDVRSLEYKYVYYMVSNDNSTTETDSQGISAFRKNYDWLELKTYNLKDLRSELSIKSCDNQAKIILPKSSVLEHNIAYNGSKSYITEISLTDIVRITSTDEDLRMNTNISEINMLLSLEIDFDILFDNVRDYLGKTKFNNQIASTLTTEPDNFFLYNNGLTITADSLESKPENMNKDVSIILKNFQVVNGGQTLRSIYNYKNSKNANLENLVNSSVLVRILDTNKSEELTGKISEYTNSQNPIRPVDLRSVDQIQLDIEKRLQLEDIKYLRKRGNGSNIGEYSYAISMEKLGQLLFSFAGHPEKAGNSKSSIFSTHYDKIFNYDSGLMNRIIKQIKYYKEIGSVYNESAYDYYELKAHYIIFIKKCLPEKSIKECIDLLENWILLYKTEKETTVSRKMLHPKFKEIVESQITALDGNITEKINLKNRN